MDNFYVQLAMAILVLVSLVAHKLNAAKVAAMADKVESMLGGQSPKQ